MLRNFTPNVTKTGAGYSPRKVVDTNIFNSFSESSIIHIIKVSSDLLKLFGYEIIKEKENGYIFELRSMNSSTFAFICPHMIDMRTRSNEIDDKLNSNEGIIINCNVSIRQEEDKFGRGITILRRGLTNQDQNPFECL